MDTRTLREYICEQVPIEEVIGQFIQLKRAGTSYKALCPFHTEKTPSFFVSSEKKIFKCFGCEKGGDVIQFLMLHEHMSFWEAVRWLASQYNIPLPADAQSEQKLTLQHKLYSLNEHALRFYENQLWNTSAGQKALQYLKKRGLTKETIRKFRIGYAPDFDNALTEHCLESGYTRELLLESKLAIAKGNELVDFFRNRIIFPIITISGKVQAFAGRTLEDSDSSPKYLNSPNSSIYEKAATFYGIHQAKKPMNASRKAFIVEGYFDVILLHQKGVENTIAPCGTELTPTHASKLCSQVEQVCLFYDGDGAGEEAVWKTAGKLLALGIEVSVLRPPIGEDPASHALNMTAEQLKTWIETNEKTLPEWLGESICLHKGTTRRKLLDRALELIANSPNPLFHEDALKTLERHTSYQFGTLHSRLQIVIKNSLNRSIELSSPADNFCPPFHPEDELLKYLVHLWDKPMPDSKTTVAEYIFAEIKPEDFEKAQAKECFSELLRWFTAHGVQNPPKISSILPALSEQAQNLLTAIAIQEDNILSQIKNTSYHSAEARAILLDSLKCIILLKKKRLLEKHTSQLKQAIKQCTSTQERHQLLQQLNQILEEKIKICERAGMRPVDPHIYHGEP